MVCPGLEDLFSARAPSHAGCQLEASVPVQGNLSEGYLNVAMIWQAAFPQMSSLREQNRSCNTSQELAPEITHRRHSTIARVTHVSPSGRVSVRGDHTKARIHVRPVLEAGHQVMARKLLTVTLKILHFLLHSKLTSFHFTLSWFNKLQLYWPPFLFLKGERFVSGLGPLYELFPLPGLFSPLIT